MHLAKGIKGYGAAFCDVCAKKVIHDNISILSNISGYIYFQTWNITACPPCTIFTDTQFFFFYIYYLMIEKINIVCSLYDVCVRCAHNVLAT